MMRGMLLCALAGVVAGEMTCPKTATFLPAAGMKVTTLASASCDKVEAEIKARVSGQPAKWHDPHNNGTYTLENYGGTVSTSRLTGDGKYTDKQIFTLTPDHDGCKIEACSRSQVASIFDMGTNYCDLKMLYCGSADGCYPVVSDFTVKEESTEKFSAATVDMAACLAYAVRDQKGSCEPHGSAGGDLCMPPVSASSAATCEGVDDEYYFPCPRTGIKACFAMAATKCNADKACVGYTLEMWNWAKSGTRIKLKGPGAISGVLLNDQYECYDKVGAVPMVADAETNVHPDRAAMIKEIQNTPGVLWKAKAHERFAAEAPGASKDLCGVKGDQEAIIKEAVRKGEIQEVLMDANVAVPDSFDSAEAFPKCAKIINDIRDQSNCGCCWAFAGAEAASDRMCISTNASIMIPLSAQDVCFNGGGIMSRGCSGGQITSPWSYMRKREFFGGKGAVSGGQYQGSGPFGKGLCSDFSMPHCHHHGPQGSDPYPAENKPGCPSQKSAASFSKCDADAKAPHNDFAADKYSFTGETITVHGESAMQQAIMAGGPMEVAFTVYSDFENYESGIYHHVSGDMAGGHAVKVVGWGVENGTKYWKIANSWNPYWGEKGYFRIQRGNNEGGIEASAVASSPDAKWSRAGDSLEVVV